MSNKRATTHVRIYKDTLDEIHLRFPQVKTADFIDTSLKTNPFLQAEAALRKINGMQKKKR